MVNFMLCVCFHIENTTLKINNPILKWTKDMNSHFAKEDTQMTKKHMRRVAKMVEKEDSELISSHWHSKITTIYRATIDEKDLRTSRK